MKRAVGVKRAVEVGSVSNDGEEIIETSRPVIVEATVTGVSDILFHRWSCDSVEEKAKASKGSKAKKSDDIESYVYRDDNGFLSIPAEYFRQSMIGAARFKQDPRSPRKSMADLAKAALFSEDVLLRLEPKTKEPTYIDRRRVVIQRNGITRERPAMRCPWRVTMKFVLTLPQYVSPNVFHELLRDAGLFVGVGDFRPTFGRFRIDKFRRVL